MSPEATARKRKPMLPCERASMTNIIPMNRSAKSGTIKSTDRLAYFFLYRAMQGHLQPPAFPNISSAARDYKSLYAHFLHMHHNFKRFLAAAPPLEQAVVYAKLVKHLAHHVVYQVVHGLWPVVKAGHRRHNDRAGARKLAHVFKVYL